MTSNKKVTRNKHQYYIHIIGRSSFRNDLLQFYINKNNCQFKCSANSSLKSLKNEEKVQNKHVVLFDTQGWTTRELYQKLDNLKLNQDTPFSLVCINIKKNKELSQKLIELGVRGVFFEDEPLSSLSKCISSIFNNELWFPRKVLEKSIIRHQQPLNGCRCDEITQANELTCREKEILRLIASGSSNNEIASTLCISIYTVKTHIRNIFRKINVPNRMQALFWASKNLL